MNRTLTPARASALAALPLRCVRQEYPNAPSLVLSGPGDLKTPRDLHPAFYGCFDWHSAVHGHWMLVRLLRMNDLPEADTIRTVLDENLSEANLLREAEFFLTRPTFERTYGWAWLLKLVQECRESETPDARRWALNLQPLEQRIIQGYLDYLPKATYPIRVGAHANSAFGLTFALDYARSTCQALLADAASEKAFGWFAADADYPAHLEPSGADFLSPSLMEADLMRRILPGGDFVDWFERFLPRIATTPSILHPVHVSDRADGQIAHLDGLNLSRAWCMRHISSALPVGPVSELLSNASERHAEAGLANVASGEYAGEHWLASFALYMLTS